MNLSAYYNRTGDPAKALEYARKALELEPKSDRAWFQKGRADERQGRLDEAVEFGEPRHLLECRAHPRTITCWPVSTAASARWKRAEGARVLHAARAGNERTRKKAARRGSRDNPGAGRE